MRIERRFTKRGQSPYEGLAFVKRSSEIRNPDGSTVFKLDHIDIPEHWTQLAIDIQSPAAEDTNLVSGIVDSLYPQLQRDGLVPFAVSAIEEWAQQPLAKILAEQSADHFGFTGERRAMIRESARLGRKELERQFAPKPGVLPAKVMMY